MDNTTTATNLPKVNRYPQLSVGHNAELFETMRRAIIHHPKKVLNNGAILLDYPTKDLARHCGLGQRKPYLGYLQPNGVVIVHTIDGIEVVRGALGYAWDLPIFEAHSKAVTEKEGKQ